MTRRKLLWAVSVLTFGLIAPPTWGKPKDPLQAEAERVMSYLKDAFPVIKETKYPTVNGVPVSVFSRGFRFSAGSDMTTERAAGLLSQSMIDLFRENFPERSGVLYLREKPSLSAWRDETGIQNVAIRVRFAVCQ